MRVTRTRTERTVSINATEKFGQAICAFANDIMNTGKPGYLFIGANNDGKPSGLHFTDELQKNLAGMRSEGNILPQPVMQVYKVTLPKGDIAVVEVQPPNSLLYASAAASGFASEHVKPSPTRKKSASSWNAGNSIPRASNPSPA